MTEAERLMHIAHERFQRSHYGNKRTFVAIASDDEIDDANRKREAQAHSVHVGGSVKVELPSASKRMSPAMLAHLCFDYYKYFCEHDRLRIERCTKCKREGIFT